MFSKFGGFVVKNRVWIIVAWVLIAVALFFFAPSLSEVGTMQESTFLPTDSESLRAREVITEYFPESKAGSSVSLVFYNQDRLTETDLNYARQVRDWLNSGQTTFKVENVTSIFDNPHLETQLISPDKTTMLLNAGLEQLAFESESQDTTREIREYLKSAPEGLEVYVSGNIGVYSDVFEALEQSIDITTIVTVILIIVLLLVIYRSPIAALVPLLTIGISFIVSRGILGLIGSAGLSIWSQIDVFLIVLVFGVGTDYCLFLVSRFREELGNGYSRSEAMKLTVSKIGAVITASAFAVIVGLAGMAVARYQMIQTMGPVLGLAIFVTLLAALTLTPALTSLFGRKLFWPRKNLSNGQKKNSRNGMWERIARFSTGRPVIVIVIVVVLMLIPYIALPGLNRSFDQIAEIPANSESVIGFKILEEHYDVGEMDPLIAIVVAPEGHKITEASNLDALVKLGTGLKDVSGIVKVQSIVQPDGTGAVPVELKAAGQLDAITSSAGNFLKADTVDINSISVAEFTEAFSRLNTYLDELENTFIWIKSEPSYQAVRSGLKDIQLSATAISSSTLVENQLIAISDEIDKLVLTQAGFDTSQLSQFNESLGMLDLYLNELVDKYPAVKSEKSYQDVLAATNGIGNVLANAGTLPLDKLVVFMREIPRSINELSGGLKQLAATFRGSGAELYSPALVNAFPASSPLNDMDKKLTQLTDNINLLSNRFIEKGNPFFISTALADSNPEMQNLLNLFINEDERAAKIYVVLSAYPQSDAALTTVNDARLAVMNSVSGTTLENAEVVIGGTSAELADVRKVLDDDFNRVLIVVIIAILIVLVFLLRSIVAPLYLLATVLLSYGTTLGIVSWIFQGLLGYDGISFMIPIIIFVLLVALGSDYNIFLMSRVREESEKHDTRNAARLALIATGGVITACGIILAGTFGVLVITPIRTMMQIGAAVAIGVLIDTFVVRALLVPAITSLLGRWSWWPGKRNK